MVDEKKAIERTMIDLIKHGVLLSKTNNFFENKGVLNPAVIRDGTSIHMFYRAVSSENKSSIGYCSLTTPLKLKERSSMPLLIPEYKYESEGMEDPRVVKIEDTFYLSYTAYNGLNALGAVATSKKLLHWRKHGIMVPQITYKEFDAFLSKHHYLKKRYEHQDNYPIRHADALEKAFIWDKNLILFPRKINGKFCFLHRIKPDIQIVVYVESLEELTITFWENYFLMFDKYIVLTSKFKHESSYVGSGCPPIETDFGWLLIYHGVEDTPMGLVYSACVALLNLENPQIEISRLPYALFSPDQEWELKGEVDNVCFPTGALVDENRLYIYYGAADEKIAIASVNLSGLISELLKYKI